MTSDFVLRTEALKIGYTARRRHPVVVAEGIEVQVRRGELVCLLGPNGAGKSTLLRTLAGLQAPLAGQVWLEGLPLSKLAPQAAARLLSLVLTERVEVGNLSAYALVALGRYPYTDWSGHLSALDEEKVRWAMGAVGAAELAGRSVAELSDGERQKVMIARALAQEPALMLLDEPTAFLDLPRRVEVLQLLRRLARQTKRAMLLSTHELDLALRYADRLWLLSKDGRLEVGRPDELAQSGALRAAFDSEGVEFDLVGGLLAARQTPSEKEEKE